jgi:YVTN family beta-propeller protein
MSHTQNRVRSALLCGALLVVIGAQAAETQPAPQKPDAARYQRDGLTIDFSASPVGTDNELREGDLAEIRFRITDSAGQPVRSLYPTAWMDIGGIISGRAVDAPTCRDKMSLYLKGIVGMRPLIDLNSYYILAMNQDSSISVIDPLVGMSGKTNLLASIHLPKPGADWVKTEDNKRLLVSMPQANQVAVIDAERFKVVSRVDVGENPLRVALQPDGAYLWVGYNGREGKDETSGVNVIDVATGKSVAQIKTGRGHHEIAFSADSRYAFVTNRHEGTVSIIDTGTLKKKADVATGPVPISVGFSSASKLAYVADGKTGTVSVVDPAQAKVIARIQLKAGLGPLRFAPDGRFALVLNPSESVVYVIDSANSQLKHTIAVGLEPYQITFTRLYAHVRSLGTERVSMIALADLGTDNMREVNSYLAGTEPPKGAQGLVPANGLVPAAGGDAAMLVVSPTDNVIYYYMEGMNAPQGTFQGYGHQVRAVEVIDRSLKETAPGEYTAKVRIPAPGTYDVAILLDNPQITHCFSAEAQPDPNIVHRIAKLRLKLVSPEDLQIDAGTRTEVRVRLIDPRTGKAHTGLEDVRVLYALIPGSTRSEVQAKEVEPGVYAFDVSVDRVGGVYAYFEVPKLGIKFTDREYVSFMAVNEEMRTRRAQQKKGQGGGSPAAPASAPAKIE